MDWSNLNLCSAYLFDSLFDGDTVSVSTAKTHFKVMYHGSDLINESKSKIFRFGCGGISFSHFQDHLHDMYRLLAASP